METSHSRYLMHPFLSCVAFAMMSLLWFGACGEAVDQKDRTADSEEEDKDAPMQLQRHYEAPRVDDYKLGPNVDLSIPEPLKKGAGGKRRDMVFFENVYKIPTRVADDVRVGKDTVTFAREGNEYLLKRQPGDIVVSMKNKKIGARKIQKIRTTDDEIQFKTTTAPLVEVIKQGHFRAEVRLNPQTMHTIPDEIQLALPYFHPEGPPAEVKSMTTRRQRQSNSSSSSSNPSPSNKTVKPCAKCQDPRMVDGEQEGCYVYPKNTLPPKELSAKAYCESLSRPVVSIQYLDGSEDICSKSSNWEAVKKDVDGDYVEEFVCQVRDQSVQNLKTPMEGNCPYNDGAGVDLTACHVEYLSTDDKNSLCECDRTSQGNNKCYELENSYNYGGDGGCHINEISGLHPGQPVGCNGRDVRYNFIGGKKVSVDKYVPLDDEKCDPFKIEQLGGGNFRCYTESNKNRSCGHLKRMNIGAAGYNSPDTYGEDLEGGTCVSDGDCQYGECVDGQCEAGYKTDDLECKLNGKGSRDWDTYGQGHNRGDEFMADTNYSSASSSGLCVTDTCKSPLINDLVEYYEGLNKKDPKHISLEESCDLKPNDFNCDSNGDCPWTGGKCCTDPDNNEDCESDSKGLCYGGAGNLKDQSCSCDSDSDCPDNVDCIKDTCSTALAAMRDKAVRQYEKFQPSPPGLSKSCLRDYETNDRCMKSWGAWRAKHFSNFDGSDYKGAKTNWGGWDNAEPAWCEADAMSIENFCARVDGNHEMCTKPKPENQLSGDCSNNEDNGSGCKQGFSCGPEGDCWKYQSSDEISYLAADESENGTKAAPASIGPADYGVLNTGGNRCQANCTMGVRIYRDGGSRECSADSECGMGSQYSGQIECTDDSDTCEPVQFCGEIKNPNSDSATCLNPCQDPSNCEIYPCDDIETYKVDDGDGTKELDSENAPPCKLRGGGELDHTLESDDVASEKTINNSNVCRPDCNCPRSCSVQLRGDPITADQQTCSQDEDSDDNNCPGSMTCQSGSCHCSTDDQCPGSAICNQNTNKCERSPKCGPNDPNCESAHVVKQKGYKVTDDDGDAVTCQENSDCDGSADCFGNTDGQTGTCYRPKLLDRSYGYFWDQTKGDIEQCGPDSDCSSGTCVDGVCLEKWKESAVALCNSQSRDCSQSCTPCRTLDCKPSCDGETGECRECIYKGSKTDEETCIGRCQYISENLNKCKSKRYCQNNLHTCYSPGVCKTRDQAKSSATIKTVKRGGKGGGLRGGGSPNLMELLLVYAFGKLQGKGKLGLYEDLVSLTQGYIPNLPQFKTNNLRKIKCDGKFAGILNDTTSSLGPLSGPAKKKVWVEGKKCDCKGDEDDKHRVGEKNNKCEADLPTGAIKSAAQQLRGVMPAGQLVGQASAALDKMKGTARQAIESVGSKVPDNTIVGGSPNPLKRVIPGAGFDLKLVLGVDFVPWKLKLDITFGLRADFFFGMIFEFNFRETKDLQKNVREPVEISTFAIGPVPFAFGVEFYLNADFHAFIESSVAMGAAYFTVPEALDAAPEGGPAHSKEAPASPESPGWGTDPPSTIGKVAQAGVWPSINFLRNWYNLSTLQKARCWRNGSLSNKYTPKNPDKECDDLNWDENVDWDEGNSLDDKDNTGFEGAEGKFNNSGRWGADLVFTAGTSTSPDSLFATNAEFAKMLRAKIDLKANAQLEAGAQFGLYGGTMEGPRLIMLEPANLFMEAYAAIMSPYCGAGLSLFFRMFVGFGPIKIGPLKLSKALRFPVLILKIASLDWIFPPPQWRANGPGDIGKCALSGGREGNELSGEFVNDLSISERFFCRVGHVLGCIESDAPVPKTDPENLCESDSECGPGERCIAQQCVSNSGCREPCDFNGAFDGVKAEPYDGANCKIQKAPYETGKNGSIKTQSCDQNGENCHALLSSDKKHICYMPKSGVKWDEVPCNKSGWSKMGHENGTRCCYTEFEAPSDWPTDTTLEKENDPTPWSWTDSSVYPDGANKSYYLSPVCKPGEEDPIRFTLTWTGDANLNMNVKAMKAQPVDDEGKEVSVATDNTVSHHDDNYFDNDICHGEAGEDNDPDGDGVGECPRPWPEESHVENIVIPGSKVPQEGVNKHYTVQVFYPKSNSNDGIIEYQLEIEHGDDRQQLSGTISPGTGQGVTDNSGVSSASGSGRGAPIQYRYDIGTRTPTTSGSANMVPPLKNVVKDQDEKNNVFRFFPEKLDITSPRKKAAQTWCEDDYEATPKCGKVQCSDASSATKVAEVTEWVAERDGEGGFTCEVEVQSIDVVQDAEDNQCKQISNSEADELRRECERNPNIGGIQVPEVILPSPDKEATTLNVDYERGGNDNVIEVPPDGSIRSYYMHFDAETKGTKLCGSATFPKGQEIIGVSYKGNSGGTNTMARNLANNTSLFICDSQSNTSDGPFGKKVWRCQNNGVKTTYASKEHSAYGMELNGRGPSRPPSADDNWPVECAGAPKDWFTVTKTEDGQWRKLNMELSTGGLTDSMRIFTTGEPTTTSGD